MNFAETLRTSFDLIPTADRRKLGGVVFVALIAAGLEAASVAIIFPFLAVAMTPDIIEGDSLIEPLYEFTGIQSVRGFQIFLGIAALVLVIASNIAGVVSKWIQTRYVARVKADLSSDLFRKILHRDYDRFLTDSPARVQNVVLSQSIAFGDSIITPIVSLIRAGVTGLAILGLLLVTRPGATLGVIVFLAGAYGLIYVIARRGLEHHGRGSVATSQQRHFIVREATGGIKEVKVYNTEDIHSDMHAEVTAKSTWHSGMIQLLGQIPFHVMQMIAFGGLMAVFLYLLSGQESLSTIIPVMGFFAFAGYRLMPPLQEAFASVSTLRASGAIVESIQDDAREPEAPIRRSKDRLRMQDSIYIDDLHFRYQGAPHAVLHGIDVTIPKGRTVAFVGSSGAGKTTLIDLIIGLLPPTHGAIRVDGDPITGNRGVAWRASIGYVPQEVVLQDASIAANIAFGVPARDIDLDRVDQAIRLAHLEHVIADLPEGVHTTIGDRGVRLSGGQRQRIGIARALYRDPDVIVFDEATSNLDSQSERAITEAIDDLSGQKTILIIAHRLTTVKRADRIYVMELGRIVSEGSYDELLDVDPHFRALALVDQDE